mmetsp:Transcript_9349/g.10852  ORF Transcript_9349/g.10852 Transcript_9349/m.10852 type:complete len:394 (-) Transcript_9349:196-1377(-)|eukprot:CAMPEP_0204841082 /NCGR_PEP_ID=MMETSP1346-20131115/40517_1 /ASSEMBLY_ACC=CAM_ASM_000771 /TAXON_ID=215587 /ORGANISM="Aplanochytrium stocchinoi, Strain GSBS06" /LENGTH=393 /DNA_ID=CAMNT_0051978963 /DNA_START=74 /DNA_END=1255 /DNA_ORIENTATION=+
MEQYPNGSAESAGGAEIAPDFVSTADWGRCLSQNMTLEKSKASPTNDLLSKESTDLTTTTAKASNLVTSKRTMESSHANTSNLGNVRHHNYPELLNPAYSHSYSFSSHSHSTLEPDTQHTSAASALKSKNTRSSTKNNNNKSRNSRRCRKKVKQMQGRPQQKEESQNELVSFKRKKSSSKYKGVLFVKSQKKWRAQICLKGSKMYIGSFDDELEAAVRRDERIRDLFGLQVELMNFPDENEPAAAYLGDNQTPKHHDVNVKANAKVSPKRKPKVRKSDEHSYAHDVHIQSKSNRSNICAEKEADNHMYAPDFYNQSLGLTHLSYIHTNAGLNGSTSYDHNSTQNDPLHHENSATINSDENYFQSFEYGFVTNPVPSSLEDVAMAPKLPNIFDS